MTASTSSSTTQRPSHRSSARTGRNRADGPGPGGRAVPADDPAHARPAASASSRVITVASGGMYTQRLDLTTLTPRVALPGGYRVRAGPRAQVALSRQWARRPPDRRRLPRHAPRVDTPGVAPRSRASAGHPADPALTRAGRRHDRLARHRVPRPPGQRPVLARPAPPGPDSCCGGRRRTRPAGASSRTGWPRRPPRTHRSWRRQGGIAWLRRDDIPARGHNDRTAAVSSW